MLERDDDGDVPVLRLCHGKASALDLGLCRRLLRELRELGESDAPAVVLTGTGTIFCAGVDLVQLADGGPDYVADFLPALGAVLTELFFLPLPVVAAVNGHAIAGGCLLAAAADLRIMSAGHGRIGVTEFLVGVPFPAVAMEVLRHLVGNRLSQELACSGRTLEPEPALAIGLVDEVVEPEQLRERALGLARQLGAVPRATFALGKRQLRQPVRDALDQHGGELDAEVERVWQSPRVRAAIRDYVARVVRNPGRP
jgi:enoyl-CoA hydratase